MEQPKSTCNAHSLDALRARMDERFADVDLRFDRFEKDVDRRFVEIDQRFDRFEGRVENRFNSIDASLQQIHRSMFIGMASFVGAFASLVVALRF